MGRRAKSQAGSQVPWAYPACNHRVKRDAGTREANLETVLVAGHFEGLVGGVNKCVYKHGLWSEVNVLLFYYCHSVLRWVVGCISDRSVTFLIHWL